MNRLPVDIVGHVCAYLDCGSILNLNLSRICPIPSHQQERMTKQIDWIRENYPLFILELFTMETMLSYPLLEEQKKNLMIEPEEMTNAVMLGKDELGRSLIAMRTIDENDSRCVTILFQRYTDTDDIWMCRSKSLDGFAQPDMNVLSHLWLRNNIRKLLDSDPQLEFPYYMREEQVYTKRYYLL